MRNEFKVAKWEIKRNLKNKSFLIGLFLTPLIFLVFSLLGNVFGGSGDDEEDITRVFVRDNLGLFETLQETASMHQLNWKIQVTNLSEQDVKEQLKSEPEANENTAYIFLDQRAIEDGVVPVYTGEGINRAFMNQVQVLETPVKVWQIKQQGLLTEEQLAVISQKIVFQKSAVEGNIDGIGAAMGPDVLNRIVPAAFAGIILLSIIFSGMYIFQSASQEKKDKVAEIILSSLTPGELMQGKIIGYFVLGMIQSLVFLGFAIPIAIWRLDVPIMEYLLVPEVILYIFIAILGYFLFAALFVGIGATMADISSAGNFQGLVMMLPFLPAVFIGPVVSDPSGLIAKIGSYIPFSAPGVLLLRLAMLEEWPWLEIIISLAILLVSIWLSMKMAGKIFKAGILMYGKNATPKEIWKWLRA